MKALRIFFYTIVFYAACNSFDSLAQNLPDSSGEKTYVIVEEMPSFIGGEEAMQTFIADNTRFPDSARQ